MALKKKNKTIAQRFTARNKQRAKVERVGTFYKEVKNSKKESKPWNFKIVFKDKAMRMIAGFASMKYSKFFVPNSFRLVTDYVGR